MNLSSSLLSLCALVTIWPSAVAADVPTPPPVDLSVAEEAQSSFRAYVAHAPSSDARRHADGRLASVAPWVTAVYEATGMQPLWTTTASPHPRARELFALLAAADADGLAVRDYAVPSLSALLGDLYAGDGMPRDEQRFAVDRMLTETFLLFAADLARGRVDPDDVGWHIRRDTLPIDQVLADALVRGDFVSARARLTPPARDYEALRRHLRRYRDLAASGGWPQVPDGPKLEIGTRESVSRLVALERRLRVEGDLADDDDTLERADLQARAAGLAADARYDARLADAVRRFQLRHGIGVDGVVGPKTMRELNVVVEARIRQIELNLERWRWMPRDLEARRLVVNVPAFTLELHDGAAETPTTMAVVVGRRSWPTPVFSDRVEYIVLNPYWNVPKTIARDELLPKVRRDETFLEREGYVLTDAAGTPLEVTPEVRASVSHRKHFLRQLPGPGNALGKMKFLFPNHWDVYLHDTPSRHLFARGERAFSHGCIRVERPFDLAEYLIRDDAQWSMRRVEALLRKGPDKWLRLENPVPVYITYFTASIDADGGLVFHPDLYDRDTRLAAALERGERHAGTAIVSTGAAEPQP